MPVCKNCNTQFNGRIIIDGVRKRLYGRKYCLNCSPFGAHNTKSIEVTASDELYTCTICGKQYFFSVGKGYTKTRCGSCVTNSRKKFVKQKCVDYKGGKCNICGYCKSLRALVFHHIDPTNKLFSISGNHCLSWDKVKVELDKCILLCSNCHAEIEDLNNETIA